MALCVAVSPCVCGASALVLDFLDIDCKKDAHLRECDKSAPVPEEIAHAYGSVAHRSPESAYYFARFSYAQRVLGNAIGADGTRILELLAESADAGYAPAQITYAKFLQSAQGGASEEWALHYFAKAHTSGWEEGTLGVVRLLYDWRWYKEAFPLAMILAKRDHAESQYLVGVMLAHGLKDQTVGVRNTIRSFAYNTIGCLFDFGKKARELAERNEGIVWLERAKKQHYSHAKDALLTLYERNAKDGVATPAQCMRLGDACDLAKTSYTDPKSRWAAIAYYQQAARIAQARNDIKGEAGGRFAAGVVLNQPYLVVNGAHAHWERMEDSARQHFTIAASFGHELAAKCLEEMASESCIAEITSETSEILFVQKMCGFMPATWLQSLSVDLTQAYPMITPFEG